MRHCTRLLLLLATLWLTACGTLPQTTQRDELPQLNVPLADLKSLQDWLDALPLTTDQHPLLQPQLAPTSVTDYVLELAKILYLQAQHETTLALLQRLNPATLNSDQLRSYALINAYNEWALGRPHSALRWLQPPYRERLAELPWSQRLMVNQLQADLYSASGQYWAAAQLRHQIYPFLPASERQAWVNALWLDVRSLSELDLTSSPPGDADWEGWLALALHERTAAGNLARLQERLNAWRQNYPNHPAQEYIPEHLAQMLANAPQPARVVAVILPLEPDLSGPGQRILEGFLAGYYQAQSEGATVPQLRLYNERSAPPQTLVQLAIDQGAELIIGPLERPNVAELETLGQLPIPILALNRTPRDFGHHPQIIQLGLAPEDEALQLARIAWQAGHQVAAALVPEGDWGQRVAAAFASAWQDLGGRLVQIQTLPARDDGRQYLAQVQSVLDLAQSLQRASNIQAVIGRPIESEPRPRTDLDVIFLATNPEQTRQLVSLLNFQLADHIQLMATSAAVASSQSARDQALDGLWVVETPWRISPHPLHSALHEAQQTNTPVRFDRLHALGLDAWYLVAQMPFIQAQSWLRFSGQTGVLQLNEHLQMVRELTPAHFVSAQLQPLPHSADPPLNPWLRSAPNEPTSR